MKSLQQEKIDHADTAFWMYENALRKTDKMMDECAPEEFMNKGGYGNKLQDSIYQMDNLCIQDDFSEKPVKSSRSRKQTKKKPVVASQKQEIKMDPLIPEPKAEFTPDVVMQPGDEEITCPCGEHKNDDWVGCDMHDDCQYEWFHLSCVKLTHLPGDNELWFCDGCKAKYRKEIEIKLKEKANS